MIICAVAFAKHGSITEKSRSVAACVFDSTAVGYYTGQSAVDEVACKEVSEQ